MVGHQDGLSLNLPGSVSFNFLYTVHCINFFLSVMEAVKVYGKMLIGRTTEDVFGNFAAVWRELAHESQFRWVRSITMVNF